MGVFGAQKSMGMYENTTFLSKIFIMTSLHEIYAEIGKNVFRIRYLHNQKRYRKVMNMQDLYYSNITYVCKYVDENVYNLLQNSWTDLAKFFC